MVPLANLMESSGVTKSPLFKIVSKKIASGASSVSSSITDQSLPSWMKDTIFVETKEEELLQRVIKFFNCNQIFYLLSNFSFH